MSDNAEHEMMVSTPSLPEFCSSKIEHVNLIGKELSGEEFNKFYETKMYKFLNDDLIHNKFKYKLGLNEDILPFNPTLECSSGGLYFCEESQCHIFAKHFGNKLAHITIPNDAKVYIEQNKFKADKLILTEIIDFHKVPDSFWIGMLQQNGSVLEFVKKQNQTEELCILAVRQNGYALKHVKNQTNEICTFAVQQDGRALQYVIDQTDEICRLAVQQNGLVLEYVKEKMDDICIMAVKQNSNALEFVAKCDQAAHLLSEELCKLAVQQNGWVLEYIKDSPILTEELCTLAVQQNGMSLFYVKNQTDEICQLAVQQNGLALKHVKEAFQTEELCKLAVNHNGLALEYVIDQTNEICALAVQQNDKALQYVKDLSILPVGFVSNYVSNTFSNAIDNLPQNPLRGMSTEALNEFQNELANVLSDLFPEDPDDPDTNQN